MVKKLSSLSLMPAMSRAMCEAMRVSEGRMLAPMFAVLPSQVELEPILDELCVELEENDLVRFTGERRWLNFRLTVSQGSGFESFERMLVSMRRSAGYSNRFRGVVRVDVTEWVDSAHDERMQALFAYIHDHSDEIFFIITVTSDDPDRAQTFRKALERWVYAAFALVKPYDTGKLVSFVEDRLAARGQKLSDAAIGVLKMTIDMLASQDDFAGIREIESLVGAISVSVGTQELITLEHMTAYSPDGSWVKRRMSEQPTTIGFAGGKI